MTTQTVITNLVPVGVLPVVHLNQYDADSDALIVKVYKGQENFNLTGCSARIQGTKQDGKGFSYSGTVDTDYNQIIFDITNQMTVFAGKMLVEVRLTKNSDDVGTLNLVFDIEESPLQDDTDVSETEIPILIDIARSNVKEAEAWARGTREGEPVQPTDETYNNNSLYYSNLSSENGEAWAKGTRKGIPVPSTDEAYNDNAKYWAGIAQQYAEGGVRYQGSVTFANIPTSGMRKGDMYNIEDDFVTDSRFQEGAGKSVKAGTNIAYNKNNKWDVMAMNGGGSGGGQGVYYGICTSVANDIITVGCDEFELSAGAVIVVMMGDYSYSGRVTSEQEKLVMNVNNTGRIEVMPEQPETGYVDVVDIDIKQGSAVTFVYDGTRYIAQDTRALTVPMDDTPTSGSQNAVTSGGVFSALKGILFLSHQLHSKEISSQESSANSSFLLDNIDGYMPIACTSMSYRNTSGDYDSDMNAYGLTWKPRYFHSLGAKWNYMGFAYSRSNGDKTRTFYFDLDVLYIKSNYVK